jgi:hypothetical protein
VCAYVRAYMCMCMSVRTCACVCAYMHVRVYVHMCVRTCAFVCVCVCACVHVRVYVRTCMCLCVCASREGCWGVFKNDYYVYKKKQNVRLSL